MILKQGDCLELMKEIPSGSVDLIYTDPPYCVGASSSGLKSSFADFSLIVPFFREMFGEWQRILKEDGHCYISTDWRTYPILYPVLIKYFCIRNCIVWDYDWIKCGAFYRFRHEFIIFATKGKSQRTFSTYEADIWKIRCINFADKNKLHSSQKPIELCEKIIKNSSNEGETVLDCCMGSGSTGVACVKTGRNFIGYELDEKYFEIAQKRIADAELKKSEELFQSVE